MCLCPESDCLPSLPGYDRESSIGPGVLLAAEHRVRVPEKHASGPDSAVGAAREENNNELADADDHAEVVIFQEVEEASLGLEGCLGAGVRNQAVRQGVFSRRDGGVDFCGRGAEAIPEVCDNCTITVSLTR
jgi:hypothetical protein